MRVATSTAQSVEPVPSAGLAAGTRRLLVTGLVLYGLSVPLVNFVLVPETIRVAILNYRPYAFAVYIAIAAVVIAGSGSLHPIRRFESQGLAPAAIGALSFPFIYAAIRLAKGNPPVDVIVLHSLWVMATFVVVPLIVRSKEAVTAVLKAVGILAGLGLAASMALSQRNQFDEVLETLHFAAGRESYGFLNPNFFSQMPQVVLACVGYLLAGRVLRPGWQRNTAWLAMAASALLIWDARSRNVLVFVGVGLGTYLVMRRRLVASAVVFGGVLLSATALAYPNDAPSLDVGSVSSGRSILWQQTVTGSFRDAEPLTTFLAGPFEPPTIELQIQRYDPLVESRAFDRYHVDNTYLEVWVEVGILGLLWFLSPYIMIARRLASTRRPENHLVLAVLAGVAAQSIFVTTIPSVGSPLGFLMLFWMVAVPLALLEISDTPVEKFLRGVSSSGYELDALPRRPKPVAAGHRLPPHP